MSKLPSEIFGYFWQNTERNARDSRSRHFCPFVERECYKRSRLVSYPFGVCAAFVDDEQIALCPRRFLEGGIVFRDIAKAHFGTIHDILILREVGVEGIGSFDFVMIKHKPMSSVIDDFVVIEFQTGQTTNTGKLVQGFSDFMENNGFNADANYNFGVNYYDIWKRTFTQILNKGIILESWRKKIFWVVQRPIFKYFVRKYRLGSLSYRGSHSSVFALYDLVLGGSNLHLRKNKMVSSSVDALFTAFRRNDDILPVDEFVKRLQNKIDSNIKLGVHLDTMQDVRYLDVQKPSSSGKVRENSSSGDDN